MHQKNVLSAGKKIEEAGRVLIMLHGRGGTAEDILSLTAHLHIDDFAVLAPQATNNSWYPYSFMVPPRQNEPWLSSALALVSEIVNDVTKQGVSTRNICFLGFSQGACLTLEFIARNAARWNGAVAFTGGLIGDKIYPENYQGNFDGTPVFIGTSNPDPHVPVERVYATVNILKNMHASVTEKIYNGLGHTINQDEINIANMLVFDEKSSDQPANDRAD